MRIAGPGRTRSVGLHPLGRALCGSQWTPCGGKFCGEAEDEAAKATAQAGEAKAKMEALEQETATLRAHTGTVEQLEAQIADLKAQIAELEKELLEVQEKVEEKRKERKRKKPEMATVEVPEKEEEEEDPEPAKKKATLVVEVERGNIETYLQMLRRLVAQGHLKRHIILFHDAFRRQDLLQYLAKNAQLRHRGGGVAQRWSRAPSTTSRTAAAPRGRVGTEVAGLLASPLQVICFTRFDCRQGTSSWGGLTRCLVQITLQEAADQIVPCIGH